MRTRTRTILAGLALTAALLGGAAWATTTTGGTIHGCYVTKSGALRVVESAADCKKNELAISWNKEGVKGEAGANGAKGDPGAKGDTGPQGLKGDTGAAGANGTNGTDGSDGAPGAVGPAGQPGPPGSAASSLASLEGTACNTAGNPGRVVVTYGPQPAFAITLACKPTVTPLLLVSTTGGAGSGKVQSTDNRFDCLPTCSREYLLGTVVTLVARPSAGHIFTGWTAGGGCTGTYFTCTLTMDVSRHVTANFEPGFQLAIEYNMLGSTGGTISVTPNPVVGDCETLSLTLVCTYGYSPGTTVTILAGRNPYAWGNACEGTTGVTCTLTLDASKGVRVDFR